MEMTTLWHGSLNQHYCNNSFCNYGAFPSLDRRFSQFGSGPLNLHRKGRVLPQGLCRKDAFPFSRRGFRNMVSNRERLTVPRSGGNSSNSTGSDGDPSSQEKTPFGYTRKDVLLIGLGVTLFGYGLKSGLEFAGVDPLQAGNVVQLVLVLGLTVGWISTYIFRVSNKEMTYAQQLRDYENKVMEKRLEGLTEAELAALLEQVEEEKKQVASGDQIN